MLILFHNTHFFENMDLALTAILSVQVMPVVIMSKNVNFSLNTLQDQALDLPITKFHQNIFAF